MRYIAIRLIALAYGLTLSAQSAIIDFKAVIALCDDIEVTEDLGIASRTNGRNPEEFVSLVRSSWRQLFDAFKNELPDPQVHLRVSLAITQLGDAEYLQALAYGLNLFCEGRVSQRVASDLLLAPMNRYGFLAVNCEHPSIRELLPRLKQKLPGSDPATEYLDMLIDGRAEKAARKYWLGNNVTPFRPLDAGPNSPINGRELKTDTPSHRPTISPVELETPESPIPTNEFSITSMSVAVALIFATIGLLWLLVKNRK